MLLHKTFYNFVFLTMKIHCIIVLLLGVTNYSFSYHLLLKKLSTRYGHEIYWKIIYIIFPEMLIREWLISPKEAGKSQFTASLKNYLELYIVLITSPECGNSKLMLLWLPWNQEKKFVFENKVNRIIKKKNKKNPGGIFY